ncbi:hypothetical protein AEYBE204_02340 [Asticcacaulis sp. YBE204]|nr:hypothetical protein AEYBE204_02340 [Asticcacaulis sp. YBE204]
MLYSMTGWAKQSKVGDGGKANSFSKGVFMMNIKKGSWFDLIW